MQPSEQFVRPTKNEQEIQKEKYEKKEIDQNTPDKGDEPEHEGATDEEIGDRTGPGAGYDIDPEKVKDKGGVV